MFFTRLAYLEQKVQLVLMFSDSSDEYILNSLDETFHQDILKIKYYLAKDTSNFAKRIINGMLDCELIDHDFLNQVFSFDRKVYEEIFQNVQNSEDLRTKYDFEKITQIAREFENLQQNVICLEWAYKRIDHDGGARNSEKHYKLQELLLKIRSNKSYPQLEDELKKRVSGMLKHLPANIKYLRSNHKIVISNLGNGLFLSSKKNTDVPNALVFDSTPTVLEMRYTRTGEDYLLCRVNDGLVMCTMPTNSSTECRVAFTKQRKNLPYWTISLCDSSVLSKGYLIKAKDSEAYLCSNVFEDFKPYVLLDKTIETKNNLRFTWNIQMHAD